MTTFNWLKSHLLFLILASSIGLAFIFLDSLKVDYIKLVNGESSQNTETEDSSSDVAKTTLQTDITPIVDKAVTKSDSIIQEDAQLEKALVKNNDNKVVIDKVAIKKTNYTSAKREVFKEESNLAYNYPPENYDPEADRLQSGLSEHNRIDVMPAQGKEVANAKPQVDVYLRELDSARRLYWDGKISQAQAAYEKLMFEFQDKPEAATELGNLLLQQGNKKGASWAYKNAIPRYLNLHREQEAISIIDTLSQYDPAIAEQLQKKYW